MTQNIKLPLSQTDVTIILSIDRGWSSNQDLAQICGVSIAAVTQKINRLEEIGLIVRENGGKYTEYTLTPTGRNLAGRIWYQSNIQFLEISSILIK
jgi:Mn-dependent DtxR family transcriptional regulator